MARNLVTASAVIILAAIGIRPLRAGAEPQIRWQTIDVPGATGGTGLTAINSAGDVVGYFADNAGVHGFVRNHRGDYQTFDYMALITEADGISAHGDIVGWYRMPGEPAMAFHGFFRSRDGELTALDYPGHKNTVLEKINADGTIVGCYHDNDMSASMHAVWLQNGRWHALEAARTMGNAITPGDQTTVGRFVDPSTGRSHGWITTASGTTTLDVPGSLATNPLGINPAGDVVGFYRDTALIYHGFLLQDGAFTTIDAPGAIATDAWDINAGGDIVGDYTDTTNALHGFIASWTPRQAR